VIRDPRDIVVSAYFSHLHSHPTVEWPELTLHRQKLQHLSEKEGLLLEMEFRQQEFQDLRGWDYAQPNILEIKMETLIQAPYQTLVEVFTFLDILQPDRHPLRTSIKHVLQLLCYKLHLPKQRVMAWLYRPQPYLILEQLLVILYHNRFSIKANGRKPGEEDVQSHYRKGVSGDWCNHFDEDHKRYFKTHYNDVLLKLGYETDSEW
jgi:hypothetical protein